MERTDNLPEPTPARSELAVAHIDWAAVLGGAVIAAAIAALCTAFGAALGLSTISAEPGEGSFNLWLAVTALWVVVSLVLSYLAGGYIAGRMSRRSYGIVADEVSARDGINGLVVWGLGILVTTWMAAGAISGAASLVGTAATATGNAISGVAQGAGSALGGVAQGLAQAAGAVVPDDVDDGVLDYLNSTLMRPAVDGVSQSDGATTPATPSMDDAELARQTGVVLGNVLRTGEISEADKEFLVSAVARRTGQSETDVEARVDETVTAVQEARAQAEQVATDAKAEAERLAAEAEETAIAAAEAARKSTILTAFLLTAAALVAGAAAVIGAVRGGRHRDEGRIWGGITFRS